MAEDSDLRNADEDMDDERPSCFNSIPLFEGTNVNLGDGANHEEGKSAWENREDECSVNVAAHEELMSLGENQKLELNIGERMGPNEDFGQRGVIDLECVRDGGPERSCKDNEGNGLDIECGLKEKAQYAEGSEDDTGLSTKNKKDGLKVSEKRGSKKGKNKMKLRKEKKRKEGQNSNDTGAGKGITMGFVTGEACKLMPSLDKSKVMKTRCEDGAKRNEYNSKLSFSINNEQDAAVLGETSIGDSDIRRCNERNVVEHEVGLAEKVWKFAKDNLGVTGHGKDEEYRDRVIPLESRDQIAKAKKGKKSSTQ